MAQANTAREPSMDEILASIRKIIESNEPVDGQTPADLESDLEHPSEPVSLLNRVGEDSSERPQPAEEIAQEVPQRPETIAPLRSGLEVSGRAPDSARSSAVNPVSQPTQPENKPGHLGGSVEVERRTTQLPTSSDEASAASDVTVEPIDDADVPNSADNDDRPADASEAEFVTSNDVSRSLISAATGARVAASFENLNQALANGPSRTFDQIAEDMLRPMLQQWMDDNLPTLVERLVREEIERVARGT